MTEDDYIRVSTLIRLRVIGDMLRQIIPHGPIEEGPLKAVARKVGEWEDALAAEAEDAEEVD